MPRKPVRTVRALAAAAAAACATAPLAGEADGAIQYFLQGSWPDDRRGAAVAAMDAAVGRYNAFGGFDKTLNVYYNAGVATADGHWNGTIRFGGTWPNERVALHEIAHTLGVAQHAAWDANMTGGNWDGPRAVALMRQFDGLQAIVNGGGGHFWDYGLNFDDEGSEINKQRHVAMMHALRADMGIGPTAHPSAATVVTATATNPLGESGFNYKGQWSDGHFAHAGAAYFSGNFAVRTPASANSFTFAGDSLTLNNKTDINGGLYFKGIGASAITTFNNLVLDGGWIHHNAGVGDLFRLDGKVTVASASTLRAKQGNINVLADVTGNGDLTITATDAPNEDNRYVRLLSPDNTFTGDVNVLGRFELAAGANQQFLIGDAGVNNAIAGATAMKVLLNGVFEFDLSSAADASAGDTWSLVTAANAVYGDTFRVDGFTETAGLWSDGRGYVFSESTGTLTFVPEPASIALLALAGLALARRRRPARPAC